MNDKPRVIHLVNDLSFGGAERFALELAQELERADLAEVQVVILRKAEQQYDSYRLRRGIVSLEFKDGPLPVRSLTHSVRQLAQLAIRFRADVIHSHLWSSDLVAALACRLSGARHVAHIHSTLPWWRSRHLVFRTRRMLVKTAYQTAKTHFVPCCEFARKHAVKQFGVPPSRCTTVFHGIHLERTWCDRQERVAELNGRVVVGSAGRFIPLKAHLELLEAARRVSTEYANLRVQLAGDGPLRRDYQQWIADHEMADRVLLVGCVTDMRRFYEGLDLYAQPSHTEVFPLVVLEAMAAGLPVVASDVGGVGEAVRHGMDGLLVPAGDVTALAHALKQLVSNPELRRDMGRRAQQRCHRLFSMSRCAEQVADLYRRLTRPAALPAASPTRKAA